MSKVKCPKCGHMNDANAEHCHNCGYRLKQSKTASATSFMQSIYKVAMACPRAAGDVELNTKNRDKTIEKHNYGPLNLNDKGYWELVADKWNTSTSVAKKSLCGNCVAFDISPRMDDCMPGPVSDGDGRLGYCWMHHFKCHSARTCTTWAKGGPIKKDEVSEDWQSKAKGMEKEASVRKDILDAFESEGGALGMKALKKHVKAPDLQSRLKDLIDEGRVYKHRHGDLIEKQASLSRNLAIGGGVLGAGTGALVDHDNRLRGALVGGSLGAGTGYAGGKYMEHLIDTDPSIVALKKRTAEINRESERATAAANKEIDAIKKRNQNLKKKNENFAAKRDEVERRYKNGEFTTSEYINKLVGLLQGEKVASAGEYDDSHMLSKILERMAAQSMHLKEKIDAGLIIPSWAEYKLYGAYDGLGKALGTAYPGEYEKEAADNFHLRRTDVFTTEDDSDSPQDYSVSYHPDKASIELTQYSRPGKTLKRSKYKHLEKQRVGKVKKTLEYDDYDKPMTGRSFHIPINVAMQDQDLRSRLPSAIEAYKYRKAPNMSSYDPDLHGSKDEFIKFERSFEHPSTLDLTPNQIFNRLKNQSSSREYKKEAGIDTETPLKDRIGLRASYRPENELGQGGGIGIGAGINVDKARRLSVGGTFDPFGDAGMLSTDYRLLPGKGISPTISLGTEGINFGLSNRGAVDGEEASTLENVRKYLQQIGLMNKEAGSTGEQQRKYQGREKTAATATKTDPAKWEAAKREAKAKMGGKHSARAMQLATQIYKKKGGGYSGAKPTSSTNSLKKWTKQDWGYSGKDKPGQGGSGVYLPKRRRDALKSTKKGRSMLAAATRKKHKATAQGKQYSSHGLAAGTSLKKSASLLKRASSRVKSPDAFYHPTMTTPAPPIETMNTGNNEVVNMQAQQVAMANQQRTQGVMPPEAPLPSIQGSTPAATPPFRPRYTGM